MTAYRQIMSDIATNAGHTHTIRHSSKPHTPTYRRVADKPEITGQPRTLQYHTHFKVSIGRNANLSDFRSKIRVHINFIKKQKHLFSDSLYHADSKSEYQLGLKIPDKFLQ